MEPLFSRNLGVYFCVEYTPHAVVMGLQLSIGGKGLEVYFIVYVLCTFQLTSQLTTCSKKGSLKHTLTN